MARARKSPVKAETKAEPSGLLSALRFVAACQKDIGKPFETCCNMGYGVVQAFNGTLAAGQKIAEDIRAAPHTLSLIAALERCGSSFTIAQLDEGRLSIHSEKFRAYIQCAVSGSLQSVEPDMPCAAITDVLKDGFNIVSPLVKDTSENVVSASILLRGGSMVATNLHVALEFWHGIDLPPNLVIPKLAAVAVAKCTKPLAKLGFSKSSVTFWFADGSFIRTQQYQEKWPDIDRVLNEQSNAWPLPENFYGAVEAVAPFNPDERVYFRHGLLCSHPDEGVGATYEIAGLPAGPRFSAKYLKLVQPYMLKADFMCGAKKDRLMFFGNGVRGVVMGLTA